MTYRHTTVHATTPLPGREPLGSEKRAIRSAATVRDWPLRNTSVSTRRCHGRVQQDIPLLPSIQYTETASHRQPLPAIALAEQLFKGAQSASATTTSHSAAHDAYSAPTFTRGSKFHVWKSNLSDRNRCLLGYRLPCIDRLVLRTDFTALDRSEGPCTRSAIVQGTLATNPDGTSSTLHPDGYSHYRNPSAGLSKHSDTGDNVSTGRPLSCLRGSSSERLVFKPRSYFLVDNTSPYIYRSAQPLAMSISSAEKSKEIPERLAHGERPVL